MIIGEKAEKVIDIIGEILAIAVITLVLVLYLNTKIVFIRPGTLLTILTYVRETGIILVLSLKALEFSLKRHLILFIITALIIAAVIVLIFFPGVMPLWDIAVKGLLLI